MNVQEKAQKSVPAAHGKAPKQKTSDSNAFAVSASTSLSDLKPLVLKHGDAFGVFDSKGDAVSSPGGTEGVYYSDTRHLSHFVITLNDRRPIVLSSTLRDDNTTLTCDLANPSLADGKSLVDHTFAALDSCPRRVALSASESAISIFRRAACVSQSGLRLISPTCSKCVAWFVRNAASCMSPKFAPVR